MKILVCGAQVPFMRGGAELHMDNLVDALRAAGHESELVRLPTAWSKSAIFDAPRRTAWRSSSRAPVARLTDVSIVSKSSRRAGRSLALANRSTRG